MQRTKVFGVGLQEVRCSSHALNPLLSSQPPHDDCCTIFIHTAAHDDPQHTTNSQRACYVVYVHSWWRGNGELKTEMQGISNNNNNNNNSNNNNNNNSSMFHQ